MPGATDVAGVIEELWAKNRDIVLRRVDDVVVGLEAIARGEAPDPEPIARQAHALAGALGTYGRPGSDVAADVEEALTGSVTPEGAERLLARVREVARALRS